jgi:hypothetical protein
LVLTPAGSLGGQSVQSGEEEKEGRVGEEKVIAAR